MNEAAEYYRIGGPVWHRPFLHNVETDPRNLTYPTNWHFCFPQAYPVSQLRFYGWGSMGARASVSGAGGWHPRTEEFFHGSAARNPIRFTWLSSDLVRDQSLLRGEVCVIGCDEEGRLWCYGATLLAGRSLQVNEQMSPGQSNALGLGRYEDVLGSKFSSSFKRANRNIATLILGDDNDLENVRFIKTQVFARKNSNIDAMSSSALSADGDIWMAGVASAWADAANFPLDTDAQLPFFRRLPVTTYIDSTAEPKTENQPLRFVNYWHRETMLALTDDNRLFMTGTRSVVGSNTWQEVAGFVDTATLINGGSGYTTTPGVTVDPPASPNGVTAIVFATASNGEVTGLRIINPGSGYGNTTPNITISGGGGSGAQAQVTVHSGQWAWASTSSATSHCAAIDTAGRLFTWGSIAINNTFAPQSDGGLGTPPTFWDTGSNWKMPVLGFNDTGKQFARVEVGQRPGTTTGNEMFGVAITIDGEVCYWGNGNIQPTNDVRYYPRLLSLDSMIGDKTFIDASVGLDYVVLLDSDGIAYTYGFSAGIRLGRDPSVGPSTGVRIGAVDQGNARFSRVFAGGNNTLALRIEELDSRGNRLNPLPYAGPPV
jgi:hypothetical protein